MFLPLFGVPAIYLSGNWAGPMLTTYERVVTQAHGQFRIPWASARGPNRAEMSYWVGLGGRRGPANLCQAGVADTRVHGRLQAGLIAEDWPAPPVVRGEARPGDWIRATVGRINGRYEATVTDLTRHESLTVGCRVPPSGAWSHAEWIAESKVNQDRQPILVSQPIYFRDMTTRVRYPSGYRWQLWMGPAAMPTLQRWGNAVVRFF